MIVIIVPSIVNIVTTDNWILFMPKPRPLPDLVCNYNRYNSTTTKGHILFTTWCTFEPSSTANMKQIFVIFVYRRNGCWDGQCWILDSVTVTCGCVLSSQLCWAADCGCQNCILWTNFYFLHNLAPPCGASGGEGRGVVRLNVFLS